jgi:DNA-binding beta-propeller fold protein YncE
VTDEETPAPGHEPPAAPAEQSFSPRTKGRSSLWSWSTSSRRSHLRNQLGRTLIGAGVGLLVLIVLLAFLPSTPHTGQAAPPVPQAPAPTPTPVPVAATAAPAATTEATSQKSIVRQVRVLGETAGLLAPQEAVQLRNGTIAVADTGHKRVVFLDAHGKPLKSVIAAATPLKEPYALASTGTTLYVLDAEGDTIDRFDARGHVLGVVMHDPALHHARGLALGPQATLLVANPATDSVLTVSRNGQILHTLGGTVGAEADQLDQPSDVVTGRHGSIYVLDNNNRRVQVVTATGAFTGQRPAPASSTLASSHVLALPDGRLVVSDPTGSLLVYPPAGSTATRVVLRVKGNSSTPLSPLGLSLMTGGKVLVTDTAGNRLLVIPSSRL